MAFSSDALRFFRSLRRHNDKPWFEAHRGEYELAVVQPMRALIEDMDVRLARAAPEVIGDPRKSMFRIHRDVRFSRDKSPYKTHAACWFYHRDARRAVGRDGEDGSAGFYFHLAPGESFVGGGIWRPPRGALNRIREALSEDLEGFETAVNDRRVRRRFGKLDDEDMLKRMPRGYEDDHPAAHWLRYQSFTLGRALSDAEVTNSRLPATLEKDYTLMLPLVRWLNGALGLEARGRR